MTSDLPRFDPAVLRLRTGSERTDHFVEFYDDDRSLVGSVATFVSVGIGLGEAAIVIGEAAHVKAIETELSRSIDLDRARAWRQYLSLDAAATLERFMEGGMPDPTRFEAVVTDMIEQVFTGERKLRIFGEMVGILWRKGNVQGAIALEDLWNGFIAKHPFRLFCAYPARASAATVEELPFGAVCDRHTHVLVPSEEIS